MFNRLSLVLLIILIIIITIIYYQSLIRKRGYTFPIQSEEQSYSKNYVYSENSLDSENTLEPEQPIYSGMDIYSEEDISSKNQVFSKKNINSILSSLLKLFSSKHNFFKKPSRQSPLTNNNNHLKAQYQPYLEYPLSNDKNLTNSNTCLLKEKDSCPLRSYKQCSNNYPLSDYNSFEICNCNVNKLCPYKLESAQEKPAIKIDCPLSHNQEKHPLILP